jgi:hypothetical protein
LQVEVTWAWETATAVVATHVAVILAEETSAQEAIASRDSAAIHVMDVEDRAALTERESQDKVSRVEAKNCTVLASTHEDAEGVVRKIALLKGELEEAHRASEVA